MQTKIEKKVFYLQAYCLIITLLVGGLLVTGFGNAQKQKFAEINVERINVVEKDGKLIFKVKILKGNQPKKQFPFKV